MICEFTRYENFFADRRSVQSYVDHCRRAAVTTHAAGFAVLLQLLKADMVKKYLIMQVFSTQDATTLCCCNLIASLRRLLVTLAKRS